MRTPCRCSSVSSCASRPLCKFRNLLPAKRVPVYHARDGEFSTDALGIFTPALTEENLAPCGGTGVLVRAGGFAGTLCFCGIYLQRLRQKQIFFRCRQPAVYKAHDLETVTSHSVRHTAHGTAYLACTSPPRFRKKRVYTFYPTGVISSHECKSRHSRDS
jgi:hypothetical protein